MTEPTNAELIAEVPTIAEWDGMSNQERLKRIDDLARRAPLLAERLAAAGVALTKISAIRDSIIGNQGFNWSEHAYPLVAVLGAAGYPGAGYEIARKNLGTIIEQIRASEAKVERLEAALRNIQAYAAMNIGSMGLTEVVQTIRDKADDALNDEGKGAT